MNRLMKNSGVEWIGEIPCSFDKKKLKYLIEKRFGGCWGSDEKEDGNNVLCIRIADFDFNTQTVKSSASTIRNYTKTQLTNGLLKNGDIIVEKSGGGDKTPVGRTVIYDKAQFPIAMFANFCDAIRPTNNVSNKYLAYCLKSFYQNMDMHLFFNQTTGLQNLNMLEYMNAKMPFPSLPEQQRIVAFLDGKCSQIDEISKKIQKEIDTLEEYKKSVIMEAVTKGLDPNVGMKDSGIEWIGEIPIDWKLDKGKYIFEYLEKPIREDDGVITCFRDGEVTLRANRRTDGFTESLQEIGYQGIDVGDLIVHGMDGFAGSIGISDSRGKASPVLNNLGTKQNKRYYMYFLRMMAWKGVFISLSTGIRVRTCDTNWGKLREITYLLPPIDEQRTIADFIDSKTAQIEGAIKTKQQQLSVLEEYKKSLIYEYVTGKKEVTFG